MTIEICATDPIEKQPWNFILITFNDNTHLNRQKLVETFEIY